jgi:hypothetical protein
MFPARNLVQKEPFLASARLPGVVEIDGPTNGTVANEGSVVFSCKPVVNAVKYELLVGPDAQNVDRVAFETSAPPDQTVD